MSTRPASGWTNSTGCAQSGNSGSGMTMPERMRTRELVITLTPWPEIVHTTEMLSRVVIADDRWTTATIESTNSTKASKLGGGRNDQAPSPTNANATDVTTRRGIERNSVAATRHAIARANQ